MARNSRPDPVVSDGVSLVSSQVTDERRELADAIARNPELYDVVSRHGLTERDLLDALRRLREGGLPVADLWTLIPHAARLRTDADDPLD
jgi:hypothetical protein